LGLEVSKAIGGSFVQIFSSWHPFSVRGKSREQVTSFFMHTFLLLRNLCGGFAAD
jgi:hypothetical protein